MTSLHNNKFNNKNNKSNNNTSSSDDEITLQDIKKKTLSLKEIEVVMKDINKNDSPPKEPQLRRGKRLINRNKAKEENANDKKDIGKSSSESDEDSCEETVEKSTALFGDEDVEGKKLFGFKSRHRKHDMVRKALEAAMESPRTPSRKSTLGTPGKGRKSVTFSPCTPRTPKNTTKPRNVETTPHRVRNRIKKRLEKLQLEDSDASDFEDSGSDFQPSDESGSSDNEMSDDDKFNESEEPYESDEDFEIKGKPKKTVQKAQPVDEASKPYNLRRTRGGKESNFIVKSDNYFSMHGSKKIVTSNHTLERLKTPRLTEDNLQTILKAQKLSSVHKKAIEELIEDHKKLFDKWLYYMSEGYSILLHGVGSKQRLIQSFQNEKLSQYPCVVMNGYFPSLTLKDILDSIIGLFDVKSYTPNEAVSVIEEEMNAIPGQHLFLIIHNIDGNMLKPNKVQTALSRIVRIPNVHLIASVDNINAPLIWDHSKLSNYNFSWWDVTTLLPYTQETSFESSLLINKSGALALSSLTNVFRSLTTNAKGIFNAIAKNQMKNKAIPHYSGISFKDLYWTARESFLVSSDLALRAQLTEFLDHKLLKQRRGADGIEHLYIPIENNLLQQFLDHNDNDE